MCRSIKYHTFSNNIYVGINKIYNIIFQKFILCVFLVILATLCDVATQCDGLSQSSLRGRFLEILCSNLSHSVATSHSVANISKNLYLKIL